MIKDLPMKHFFWSLAGFAAIAYPGASADTAKSSTKDSVELSPPETELGVINTDLENARKSLGSINQLSKKTGLGPQTIAAERAFNTGMTYFGAKEYLSAIRELSAYLNSSQIMEPGKYLKAQYLLGRSHEETGQHSRALKAYLRYLSTFMTHKQQDFEELDDILHRIVPLAARNTTADRRQLDQFLSSVMNLDLPKEIYPSIALAAARTAAENGHSKVAETWLENVIGGSNNPEAKHRAVYLRAVMDIAAKDYESAENRLNDILTVEGKETANVRDQARLALARIAVHRKKPELALKYYGFVDEISPSFKDALFESIYVHLDSGQEKDARSKAKFFVTRYPMDPSTFQVKTLLSYLDLRAGDVESARNDIANTTKELAETQDWLARQLQAPDRITQATVYSMIARTSGVVDLPPYVGQVHEQFTRIANATERLALARSESRNLIFTLGRANLEDIRPEWTNRATQLEDIGNGVLAAGNRLAVLERMLMKNHINEARMVELESAEARRSALLAPYPRMVREYTDWQAFAAYAELMLESAELQENLAKAEANLAAVRLAKSHHKAKASSSELSEAVLSKTAVNLREKLHLKLEEVRKRRLSTLANNAPHNLYMQFMTKYALSVTEDQAILSQLRPVNVNRGERMLLDEIDRTWKIWKESSRMVFERLKELESDINSELGNVLGEIQSIDKRHTALLIKIDSVTDKLERLLGKSAPLLNDLYAEALNTRLSKQRKWSADLEWIEYSTAEQTAKEQDQKTELEQQILKEHLKDLQQGVTWK